MRSALNCESRLIWVPLAPCQEICETSSGGMLITMVAAPTVASRVSRMMSKPAVTPLRTGIGAICVVVITGAVGSRGTVTYTESMMAGAPAPKARTHALPLPTPVMAPVLRTDATVVLAEW